MSRTKMLGILTPTISFKLTNLHINSYDLSQKIQTLTAIDETNSI